MGGEFLGKVEVKCPLMSESDASDDTTIMSLSCSDKQLAKGVIVVSSGGLISQQHWL